MRMIRFSHKPVNEDMNKTFEIKYIINGEGGAQHTEKVAGINAGDAESKLRERIKNSSNDSIKPTITITSCVEVQGKPDTVNEDVVNQEYEFDVIIDGDHRKETVKALNLKKAEDIFRKDFDGCDQVTILSKKAVGQDDKKEDNNQQESLKREGSFILSEDWFDDITEVEVLDNIEEPEEEFSKQGPNVGPDTGIAALLIDAINDEWTTIDKYNSIITMMSEENKVDMIPVIQDITAEENTHVGQLQTLLQSISPNVENIVDGETEAKEQMNGEDE